MLKSSEMGLTVFVGGISRQEAVCASVVLEEEKEQ